jgi:MFS transporter, DHA1 family, tetracycline resistance protein
MNKALVVILAAVILDMIGIGLIFPILPSLLRELTGSGEISALYGVILAAYAAMQFLMGPILGTLSDRFGRRPVLLASLAGAMLDYLVLAFSPFLWLVILGRIVAGITAANFAVATAYLADITPESERARRFGYLHAAFGIGFIIGPVLGGMLGEFWVRAPFLLAALLNGLNFLLALYVLPESHRPAPGTKWDMKALNPFAPIAWVFSLKVALPLVFVFVLINFVGSIYGTVWVLYGEDRFDWTPFVVGLSLTGYGAAHTLAQLFLVEPVTRWVGERGAVLFGIVTETIGVVGIALVPEGWMVFALLPLFAIAGVGMPALQSMISIQAGKRQGQMQGVLASLMSLTSVFGPLFFAMVYAGTREIWPGTVWIVGIAFYVFAIWPLLPRRD